MSSKLITRGLKRPITIFILAGAAIFTVVDGFQFPKRVDLAAGLTADAGKPVITISRARVEQLRADFLNRTGSLPSAAEETALIDTAITTELLYRTAVAMGYDKRDQSARSWLVEKMRFVSPDSSTSDADLYFQALSLSLDENDPVLRNYLAKKMELLVRAHVASQQFTDIELRTHFKQHQAEYRQPARISLSQIYLSDARGDSLAADARKLLRELRSESVAPERADEFGDPYPVGNHHRSRSADELVNLGGPRFALAVGQLEPGAWSEPIESEHGLHLVWIEAQQPSKLASFESVRDRVRLSLVMERSKAMLAGLVTELRKSYAVRVQESSGPSAGSSGA